MKILTLLTIGVVTLALSGCGQMQDLQRLFKKSKAEKPVAQAAVVMPSHDNEVRLAEVILKPKQRKLSVKSDPFQPLTLSNGFSVDGGLPMGENGFSSGMQYMGMIKMGSESSVLIKTAKGSGVYKLNDEIEFMRITGIEADFITLTKDGKTFQLKRGAP